MSPVTPTIRAVLVSHLAAALVAAWRREHPTKNEERVQAGKPVALVNHRAREARQHECTANSAR